MLRFVNVCLVLCLVALAYVIYEVKYESRALDAEIARLQKDIEVERDAVAVLRAEWSLLNRPERIERLAEKYLKLAPAKPTQLVTLDTLKEADFELANLTDDGEKKKKEAAPTPKTVSVKPAPAKPAQAWSTTTVAADDAKPERKAPVLATTAMPPVSVSMPGE